MNNAFHIPISIEEFKYAIGIWSAAITGKLPVPEILSIPEDSDNVVVLEFSIRNNSIRFYKNKDHPALAAYIAVAKTFCDDPEKSVSVLLHCFILEKILTNPIFYQYTQDRSFFNGPYLDLIKDIPIKIGEERLLNNINMEYILEKFKSF